MLKKLLVASLLFGTGIVFAGNDSSSVQKIESNRMDKIEETVANIVSKAGISFSGEFHSQFLYSKVDSSKGKSYASNVSDTTRRDEGVEYTAVDFTINARPNTMFQGKLILRLHQDWRNFFSSFKSPIMARWISMDGNYKDIFRYNIGDFKQKYSSLTLYSPDVNIDYEPEIFAKLRRKAMNEEFLSGNERVLQGLNFNFDAEISPIFNEFHWNILGARLRSSGVAPQYGGNSVISAIDAYEFDKYTVGTNLNMIVIPDYMLGFSYLKLFDDKKSYADPDGTTKEVLDTLAQNSSVIAGRLSIGTAPFLDTTKANITLGGEFAFSKDDSSWVALKDSTDTVGTLKSSDVKGMALKAGIKANFTLGLAGHLNLSADFVRNNEDFRNELAQSPTLFKDRIMNVENDLSSAALYSTFDAMYRDVFKFASSDDLAKSGFFKGPVRKIAYTNTVFTQDEMKNVPLDTALFLVMPNGDATANRTGIVGKLSADFLKKAVVLSADVKMLNELSSSIVQVTILDSAGSVDTTLYLADKSMIDSVSLPSNGSYSTKAAPATKFSEIGGGISLDIGKFGNWWKHPFVLSCGYKLSTAKNSGFTGNNDSKVDINVSSVNGGLYWTFIEKLSLLGGVQYLATSSDLLNSSDNVLFNQIHWAAGLEYKVSEGGTLTGSIGQTNLYHEVATLTTMDNYWQSEIYLTVKF